MEIFFPAVFIDYRRIRNYGTAKLTRAADLALDKITDSKYNLHLGDSSCDLGKVTGKWRHITMGQVLLGVKRAGLLA
jgi:hypothetical protein